MSSGDWLFTSSSTSSSKLVKRCGVDEEMVEIELDAARVLADFAHIALLDREGGGGGGGGGSADRKTTRKRSRNNNNNTTENNTTSPSTSSSPDKTVTGGKDKVEEDATATAAEEEGLQLKKRTTGLSRLPLSVDLNQRALPEEEDMADGKHDQRTRPGCSSSSRLASFCVGRGKAELTEVEKEAKKLRRVLANRESARQTIRRRQALSEELMRKAAGLARENEEMKREKEFVLKEYRRLNDANKELKRKVTEKIEEEEASTRLELETPSSSMIRYTDGTGAPETCTHQLGRSISHK